MKNKNYYTLITSLPHLPRFDKVERLPITRERLLHRLKMLDQEDYNIADKAAEFISWRRQPLGKTNEDILLHYNRWINEIFESPLLKSLFEFPVNQRTIMVALRRRFLGMPPPSARESWGAGKLIGHIQRHWEDPTFKLGAIYPWISEAQAFLKEGESLRLEHLLFNLMWNKLDRQLTQSFFGFDVVIAYLLKWDILQQWLSYNVDLAKIRLESLVAEIMEEYERNVS